MKKIVAFVAVIALFGTFGVSQASAGKLTSAKAERAVEKRVASKYGDRNASADCRRLSNNLATCSYLFTQFGGTLCEGGARVRKFPYGLLVRLGKPHEYFSESKRCY
jgi:hypothetical protein